jgi:hypothetical protein
MKFKSDIDIESLSNATTDTDRFVVSDGGILKYRTGSQVLSDIGGQSALTNPVTGTGVNGRVAFWTGTTTQSSDAGLFWDNTNKRLGIGTTGPGYKLDVVGKIALNDGGNSVFIGTDAGLNDDASDNRNIGVGYQALYSNTIGGSNTAIGWQALYSNTTGGSNVAIGREAGQKISNGSNQTITNNSIFIGQNTRALANNQTNQIVIGNAAIGVGSNSVVLGNDNIIKTILKGDVGIGTTSPNAKLDVSADILVNEITIGRGAGNVSTNTAVGISALSSNTAGTSNTAVGRNALLNNTAGTSNTAVGREALSSNTEGDYNTAVGIEALANNTTGNSNVAVGRNALLSNTTGNFNTSVGTEALSNNTTGSFNTSVGVEALYSNTTGYFNTAVGLNALYENTTGYDNSALGFYALQKNTEGFRNTAMGYRSLRQNTTGFNNSAFGHQALRENITGNNNVAIGFSAILNNTTGVGNVALGRQALSSNTTGVNNISLGVDSFLNNTTGNRNIALGWNAGNITSTEAPSTSSSDSIFIGNNTRPKGQNQNNQIVIGKGAIGIGSNTVVLGDDNIEKTILKGSVGIGNTIPLYKLDVTGTGRFTEKFLIEGNDQANARVGISNTGTNGREFNLVAGVHNSTQEGFSIYDVDAAATRLVIQNSGNISIGNINDDYKLDVSGTGRFTGDVTATNFVLSSDKKLKSKIEDVVPTNINANWKTFELKSEKGQKRYGVIAQELEKEHPEFVRTDKEGIKSVSYIDLLVAKNAELEDRITKLEKLIEKLI